MISIARDHSRNVKRWRDGTMTLRWCAAGMVEAGKQFRRVNGHLHLRALRSALERHTADSVGPDHARSHRDRSLNIGPPPKIHAKRDNLALRSALERHTADSVGPNHYGPTETAA